jgi:integrase
MRTIGAVEFGKGTHLRVEQAARVNGAVVEYGKLKTEQSYRRVPLTADTTQLIQDYLAMHPRGDDPAAPLFPGMTLAPAKPTGVRATDAVASDDRAGKAKATARRQATTLAELAVTEAEARLVLDWATPLRHPTFYKAVYRPAVLRANRVATASGDGTAALPADLKFHTLRHTSASLCINAGIKPIDIAAMMGHRNVKTTLTVYAHLINTDDHAGNMAALGALAKPKLTEYGGNVIPFAGSAGSAG